MHLALYRFTGDSAQLLAAYDRMSELMPGADLRICAAQVGSVTVLDACPDRATFERFSTSEQFHAALAAVGLPRPDVRALGEIHQVVGSASGVSS
jgi:hypothetical protein